MGGTLLLKKGNLTFEKEKGPKKKKRGRRGSVADKEERNCRSTVI